MPEKRDDGSVSREVPERILGGLERLLGRTRSRLGKLIVDLATGETEEPDPDEGKNLAAVELGRKGGLKGGRARAKMTPRQRSEAASHAAKARRKRHP